MAKKSQKKHGFVNWTEEEIQEAQAMFPIEQLGIGAFVSAGQRTKVSARQERESSFVRGLRIGSAMRSDEGEPVDLR